MEQETEKRRAPYLLIVNKNSVAYADGQQDTIVFIPWPPTTVGLFSER